MKIYADMLFAINFSMDLISLFICASIVHKRVHKKRVLASAVIGGIYGVIEVIMPSNAIASAFLGVSVAFLMCFISFYQGSIKRLIGMYILYWGCSACLGGIMSVLYSFLNKLLAEYIENYSYTQAYTGARFFVIASLAVILSIILGRFFSREKEIIEVEIIAQVNTKTFEAKGICDSGNLLREPISGKSVILVSEKSQIGQEINKIADVFKRYIPYNSVGGGGILKGVLPKSIKINGTERSAIIAPVSQKDFAGYEACVPISLV
ncbi:MAG: sigma-E processing peptidase SpoIIGA [Clostridia bacterium]|nr:sigma-E processing peptidase SpoIIGA [Clostridia bacterium]